MADLAVGASRRAEAPEIAAGGQLPTESDVSLRKIRVATICLAGTTFGTSLLPFMALSYVLVPMTREFGWTRAEFLLANSFLMWFGALTLWGLGRMTDTIGARPVIIWGTLAVGLVTLAAAHLQNIWQLYGLFALLGVFGSSGASYSKVISSLFTQNRGKAMAIFGAEGAAVRSVIPMMVTFLILNYQWRGMFTALGVIILAIVPVLYLGLDEPGRQGRLPTLFGRRRRAAAAAAPEAPALVFEGLSMRQVVRDRVFWLMLFGGLVSMMVGNGVMVNVVAAMQDRGFSAATVGKTMGMATFAGLAGALLGGVLMDKVHTAKIAIPYHLATALGAFILMGVSPAMGGVPLLFAALSLGMFAMAASVPMTTYFLTRYFGLKSFAEIYGLMSAIQALCMGFSAPLIGYIYDSTHSYAVAFIAYIVTALISAGVFLILPRYRFAADISARAAPAKAA